MLGVAAGCTRPEVQPKSGLCLAGACAPARIRRQERKKAPGVRRLSCASRRTVVQPGLAQFFLVHLLGPISLGSRVCKGDVQRAVSSVVPGTGQACPSVPCRSALLWRFDLSRHLSPRPPGGVLGWTRLLAGPARHAASGPNVGKLSRRCIGSFPPPAARPRSRPPSTSEPGWCRGGCGGGCRGGCRGLPPAQAIVTPATPCTRSGCSTGGACRRRRSPAYR